jgi:4-hydroxybenzoate polyprenyltransferase
MFENFIQQNDKIIGIIHFLFAMLVAFYGIIFKKNMFDFIYILYIFLVLISWTFYNGECVLTYVIKKIKDKNYIAGTESTDMHDMYLLFGSREIINLLLIIGTILGSISFYIVLKRNDYPNYIYYILPLLLLLYTSLLRINNKDIYKNKYFLVFQEIIKYYVIINLIYILYLKCIKK